MWYNTRLLVLTAGKAQGCTILNAFDNALRDAKISDFNFIKVTSIVPPNTPIVTLNSNADLIKGQGILVPSVFESLALDNIGEEISAGVGVGLNDESEEDIGTIFTYSCRGSKQKCEDVLKQMINEGMAKRGFKNHRSKIVSVSTKIEQCYTSVVALAIFCDEPTLNLFEGCYR